MNHLSGTDLICCDGAGCNKAYHATCAGIEDINALPETWYCPSCTIRSRINTKKEQSQSKMPPSAKQEAGSSTAAVTTVSSPDVPISIDVKKDTDHAYDDETDNEDDTDEFESCKSSQSSTKAKVDDHKASDTKDDEDDGDGDNILARYGDKDDSATSSTIAAVQYVNQVIAEGCGMDGVNGVYTKIVGQMYKGAPMYSKRSTSTSGNKIMYRDSTRMENINWYISHWDGNTNSISQASLRYYGSPKNADSMTPPTNGWAVIDGFNPVPRCQLVVSWLPLPLPSPQPIKKCGKCGKEKKKWSYAIVEWNKSEDRERICLVCTKAKEKWDKNKDYMRYPNP